MQSCLQLGMHLPRMECSSFLKAMESVSKSLPYINRISGLTRHGLNASLQLNHRITEFIRNNDKAVKNAIARLKFLSILNIVSHVLITPTLFRNAVEAINRGNRIDAAIGTIFVVTNIGDIVDNVATFTSGCLTLASKAPIEFFTKLVPPLGISLLTFNTAVKVLTIIKIKRLFSHFSDINTVQFEAQGRDELNRFLRSLGITELTVESLQRNKSLLLKSLPKKIASELSQILDILMQERPNEQTLMRHLEKVGALFKKNLNFEWGNLVANILGLIGLALFALPVAPFLPFAFLFLREILRLSLQLYHDC